VFGVNPVKEPVYNEPNANVAGAGIVGGFVVPYKNENTGAGNATTPATLKNTPIIDVAPGADAI